MKIYSPSYKRADGVKTHLIIPEVIYCVHEFEADQYRAKKLKIEVMPDELRGNLARVRNYILDNYIKREGVMIDDDIHDAFTRGEYVEKDKEVEVIGEEGNSLKVKAV